MSNELIQFVKQINNNFMKNHISEKIATCIITIIMLLVLIQGKSFSQNDENLMQKDHKNPQALTADQISQIKAILSQYNPSTLTSDDAKVIHEKFREAGIHAGPETKDAIIAAGFDPEKLRTLAPPPTNDRMNGPNPPTIEERLENIEEKVIKPLSLNSNQIQSINEASKDFYTEMDNLKKNQSNPQERLDKSLVEPIERARDEKVKLVLTKEQFVKYLELEKATRPQKPKDKESLQKQVN